MTLRTTQNENPPNSKPGGFLRSPLGFIMSLTLYWPLVLGIGFFFGWLLSFPMKGPALGVLAQSSSLNLTTLFCWFLIGHILGLACAGIAGYFQRRYLVWYTLAAVPIAVLTMAFSAINPAAWPVLLGLMGFLAGVVVIGWGVHFAWMVDPDKRGRTFIMGAILANLILYLINMASRSLSIEAILIPLGLMTLVMPVLLISRCRQQWLLVPDAALKETPGTEINKLRIGTYLLFIFAIYTVTGLLSAVLPLQAMPASSFMPYYALIPYMIFLLIAGFAADKLGRRANALLGVVVIGLGLILADMIHGNWQYFLVQTMVIGGYAFLDTFTWVLAADSARSRRSSLTYSIVLCTNILAIIAAVFLARASGTLASADHTIIISLIGMFTLVSIIFVIALKETPTSQGLKEPGTDVIAIDALVRKSGLTPREADIARLLIAGATTQEMLAKLVIAPDTLKSHLRNLYHKIGARNRVEFTLAVLKEYRSSGEDKNQ